MECSGCQSQNAPDATFCTQCGKALGEQPMSSTPQTASEEWSRHWPLVLAGLVGMSFLTAISTSLGMFMEPLQHDFGWSREEISLGLTIFTGVAIVGSTFMGALIDHLGTRPIAIIGMTLSAAAFAAFGLANRSMQSWIGLWVILAFVALAIKSTVWTAAVSSVFTVSRGLALAVVLSGTALGLYLAPIITRSLIDSHGWRSAYAFIGAGWGGISVTLAILFFHDAREIGGLTGGEQRLTGLSVSQALRSSQFLRIAGASLVMSLISTGVTIFLFPILVETGLDRATTAEIATTLGIAAIAGKLVTGWLLDRFQGDVIPFSSFALSALGYFLLLNYLHSTSALMLGGIVLGFSSGATLQVTTYLVSRYTGLRSFGTMYGMIGSALGLGALYGPMISGLFFDGTGGGAAMLTTAIPVALVCAMMMIGLGPYPDFGMNDESMVENGDG